MLLPTDFWRAAKYLISRYGSDAGERAQLRANELREAGETNLHKIWHVLAATVAELDARETPPTAPAQVGALADRGR